MKGNPHVNFIPCLKLGAGIDQTPALLASVLKATNCSWLGYNINTTNVMPKIGRYYACSWTTPTWNQQQVGPKLHFDLSFNTSCALGPGGYSSQMRFAC